jgi:hypothetical protein
VEADLNTSTVSLIVVVDGKGTQYLGYNWATLTHKYKDLFLRVGGSTLYKQIIVAKSKEVKTGWYNLSKATVKTKRFVNEAGSCRTG